MLQDSRFDDFELDLLNSELFGETDFSFSNDLDSTSSEGSSKSADQLIRPRLSAMDYLGASGISNSLIGHKVVKTARPIRKIQSSSKEVAVSGARLQCFNFNPRRSSLENLPGLVSMHMNTGNVDGLKALLKANLRPDSVIRSNYLSLNVDNYITFMEYGYMVMYPDSFMLLQFSKPSSNSIKGQFHFKQTDNVILRQRSAELIRQKLGHNSLRPTTSSRGALYRKKCIDFAMGTPYMMDEERFQEYLPLLDSDENLNIYGVCEVNVYFDEITKMVKQLWFNVYVTSITRQVPTSLDASAEDDIHYTAGLM